METTYQKKIEIDYHWKIPAEHKLIDLHEQLDEDAFERISTMIQEGYLCGELHTYINTEEGKDQLVSGWWSLKEGSANENT